MTDDHFLIPYVFARSVDRKRPGTRIETASLDRLRDLVAWLLARGAPASLEQELSIAVEKHVRGEAARYGLDAFPPRDGFLPNGRRSGVWRKPVPADQEAAAAAKTEKAGDYARRLRHWKAEDEGRVIPKTPVKQKKPVEVLEAGDSPVLVAPSPRVIRQIDQLLSERMNAVQIADLLEVDVAVVRATMLERELYPKKRKSGPVRPHYPPKKAKP